jgi:uncharacterized membrane protein HdeD (DUF308 family)
MTIPLEAHDELTRRWWAVALRGVIAVLFGIIAFARPGLTILALVAVFGVYALFDGALAIAMAFWAAEHRTRWWPFAIEGLAGIAVGILTFVWPVMTAVVLTLFIAWWAIITGVLEIAAAIRLRRVIQGEWLLAASGVLSVIFGVWLLVFPAAGAVSVVWVIGAYALVFGVLLLTLAFRLRRIAR